MTRESLRMAGAALAALLAAGEAAATEPRIWKLEGLAARKAGEREDVSLDWDGTITLAPRRELIHKWPAAQIWSLARDRKGTLYVGTGNEGLLLALKPGAEPEVLLDAQEPIVQALVLDSGDRCVAATSPGGKVYRLGAPGKDPEVLFDPPETYIWALARTPKGELLVATGDPAVLYRVGSGGEAVAILRTEERHLRSLAVGPAGDIYAGSAENAYIYRITPQGEAYVLHDASGREISALALDPVGVLFAAAVGGPAPAATEPQTAPEPSQSDAPESDVTVTVTVTASADDDSQAAAPARSPAAPKAPRAGGRGTEVYRIRPDGYPEVLWRSATEVVHALATDPGGDVLLGVGDPATVLRVSPRGKEGEWVRLEGGQVTQLLRVAEGEWVAATSNLGSVVRLGPGRAAQGTYTSPVKDAGIFSDWGKLRWDGTLPRGAGLELEVRSGNTQSPGDTWSAWRPLRAEAGGAEMPAPSARFLQWRARLRSDRGAAGPVLRGVEAYYRQRNVAPEVTSVRVEEPGLVIQAVPVQAPTQQAQAQSPVRRNPAARGARRPPATRRTFEKGKQTISWTASDRNQDTLNYDLSYRRQEESRWKPLKEGVEEEFYAFDTTSLPDGRYRVRVLATDLPSNAAQEALNGEAESEEFPVDNTPPAVQALQGSPRGKRVEVSFEVADTFSPVQSAEVALDGGEWTAVNPEDGVADSTRERYRTELEAESPGEHTVGVRATDQMGNRGAGHLLVEIP